MRQAFIDTLTELAEKDKNLYLLTGDLGYSVFENFTKKFPKRFINCGVAEQNMMNIAAGLALSGKKVYVYSIIPFAVMRCFEQIRNNISYQNLDVKIIGIGTGFSYAPLGFSHYGVDDVTILRSLPNIVILSPADPVETRKLILESYKIKAPTYIRLDKEGKEVLYSSSSNITIGKPSILKKGTDGAIITTGIYLKTGMKIVEMLKIKGYDFELISMHTLKPINPKALINTIKDKRLIFTLEEHNISGGLGSILSEIISDYNISNIRLKRIGLTDIDTHSVGSRNYLRKYYKIDDSSIYKQIIRSLKRYEK